MAELTRKRRLSRQLDELPGLFDFVDIARDDIAGDIIGSHFDRPLRPVDDEIDDLKADSLVRAGALKFISFGSGSSGNCAYVGTDAGGVLIDAGVDNNFVCNELLHNGIDINSVKGILLTHDHGDHVKYAYSILRRNRQMRLYCTPKTLGGMLRRHNISRRIKDYHAPVYKEFEFEIAGMKIVPFDVSHDGTDNVGYCIDGADVRFVVTTDTGHVTPRADFYMRGANCLMIESNYDRDMLVNGSYPEYLKARIMSDSGHLDNAVTASYLASIASPSLTHVFLCHLSHDNNKPEIALSAVRAALEATGVDVCEDIRNSGLYLSALPRFGTSRLFVLRKRV